MCCFCFVGFFSCCFWSLVAWKRETRITEALNKLICCTGTHIHTLERPSLPPPWLPTSHIYYLFLFRRNLSRSHNCVVSQFSPVLHRLEKPTWFRWNWVAGKIVKGGTSGKLVASIRWVFFLSFFSPVFNCHSTSVEWGLRRVVIFLNDFSLFIHFWRRPTNQNRKLEIQISEINIFHNFRETRWNICERFSRCASIATAIAMCV